MKLSRPDKYPTLIPTSEYYIDYVSVNVENSYFSMSIQCCYYQWGDKKKHGQGIWLCGPEMEIKNKW